MKIWDSWKDRFYAIFWIYKMCHDKKLAFFYDSELWPDWKGVPQEIFADEAVAALKKGIDSESIAVLNNFIQKLSIDLTLRKDRFSVSFPEYTEKTKVAYLEYMQKEQKEYPNPRTHKSVVILASNCHDVGRRHSIFSHFYYPPIFYKLQHCALLQKNN